jgi:hypothetical protein
MSQLMDRFSRRPPVLLPSCFNFYNLLILEVVYLSPRKTANLFGTSQMLALLNLKLPGFPPSGTW